jgi:hypothetical protein
MENFKKTELKINEKLYLISGILTLLVMLMFCLEFFTGGEFPEVRLRTFYIFILLIYTIHKEFIRWLGEKEIERRGEFFVYLWIGFAVFFYLVDFFTKNRFDQSSALNEITLTSLEVLAIFILSRISKSAQLFFSKKPNQITPR